MTNGETRPAFSWIIGLVIVLWVIEIINLGLDHNLCRLGIYPRDVEGLYGILLSPFLHFGFGHLLMNTLPLIILGGLVMTSGTRVFLRVTVLVTLLSGIAVWLIGRPAYHVGISGVIFGYFGYVIGLGFYERSFRAILASLIALFLYGGAFTTGILPVNQFVSWEGHLFGLLAGIGVARSEVKKRKR